MNERKQETLLNAFDQRFEKYQAESKRCELEFSNESIHDLRVATRRLLAILDLMRVISAHPRVKKLSREFKSQLESLNELRDTQVMLAEFTKMLDPYQELGFLIESLKKREKRLLKDANLSFLKIESGKILRRIEIVRTVLTGEVNNPGLAERMLGGVDDAFHLVASRKAAVSPAKPATIHHMRVSFKKMRYMIEIIHPILPGYHASKQFKKMHAFQSAMGDIQDVEVILQTLAVFAKSHRGRDLKLVRNFYRRRHADLIGAWLLVVNEVMTFWREAPDKPFPWERTEKE